MNPSSLTLSKYVIESISVSPKNPERKFNMQEPSQNRPVLQKRRSFIKTTGGASVASILTWKGLVRPAMAQESGGSQGEWGMRCQYPYNNVAGTGSSDGYYEFYDQDPIGSFITVTVNGTPGQYRKWTSIKIRVDQASKTKNADENVAPYNSGALIEWKVVEARSWWEIQNDPNGTSEHVKQDLKVYANPISRSALGGCDTRPSENEITFALTVGEKIEDTDSITGIKVTTEVKVEEEGQEGSIKFKARVTHPAGGEGDWEIVDHLFVKEPK